MRVPGNGDAGLRARPYNHAGESSSVRMPLEATRKKIAYSSGGTSGLPVRTAAIELIRDLNLRGAVADFGAGKGDMIRSLLGMDRFSSIAAFDLMERPSDIPASVRWCTSDLNQPVDQPPESFDLVTALGLIEYLENPFAFARELYRVLRPKGMAILTTPNNESWRALISLLIRGHFTGFPPMGKNMNLTALVRSDFERILHFARLQDVVFFYSRVGVVPGLRISWQVFSGGILRGKRFSDDLVVACRKP
jgi:SAM-dependent methyltransferase